MNKTELENRLTELAIAYYKWWNGLNTENNQLNRHEGGFDCYTNEGVWKCGPYIDMPPLATQSNLERKAQGYYKQGHETYIIPFEVNNKWFYIVFCLNYRP